MVKCYSNTPGIFNLSLAAALSSSSSPPPPPPPRSYSSFLIFLVSGLRNSNFLFLTITITTILKPIYNTLNCV